MGKLKKLEKLLYPTHGVLEKDGEFPDSQLITSASTDPSGNVIAKYSNGSSESFPTDSGNLEPYSAGIVKFKSSKGGKHRIRPVVDTDGLWASSYGTALPPQAIVNLHKPPASSDGSSKMPYLQDNQETMVAFTGEDDDQILGILYINKFGGYIRQDGSWIGVSPDDDSFNETTPYYVTPGGADDFIRMFDSGPVTTEQAAQYLTSPDGSAVDSSPAPEDNSSNDNVAGTPDSSPSGDQPVVDDLSDNDGYGSEGASDPGVGTSVPGVSEEISSSDGAVEPEAEEDTADDSDGTASYPPLSGDPDEEVDAPEEAE
jgi:hypothetical protein